MKQFVILFCESCYRNKYLLTLLMYSYHLSLDINKQIDTDTILSLCIRKTQQKITIQTQYGKHKNNFIFHFSSPSYPVEPNFCKASLILLAPLFFYLIFFLFCCRPEEELWLGATPVAKSLRHQSVQ